MPEASRPPWSAAEYTSAHPLLPVDDAGPRAQPGERLDDQREAIGQVIARPAVELHARAICV